MFNYLKIKNSSEKNDLLDLNFFNEKIFVNNSNYYFSNVIARASKIMSDCNNAKIKLKQTGTEGK